MGDLADQHGVAIGIVLHDLDQAAALADDIALLDRGQVCAVGSPREVLTSDLLTGAYGIRIEVDTDPVTRSLRTRPVGRYSSPRSEPLVTRH